MNAETVSKPVIVGVDGSEYSSAALRYAGALAARLVEEALGRAFTGERPQNIDVTVRFGPPGKVLVDESRRAQLLVVGRHGEGGFLGTSMGSVSKACAAHSVCPVLLVGQEADDVP